MVSIFGGESEPPDKSPRETALRELAEETGLDNVTLNFLGNRHSRFDGRDSEEAIFYGHLSAQQIAATKAKEGRSLVIASEEQVRSLELAHSISAVAQFAIELYSNHYAARQTTGS